RGVVGVAAPRVRPGIDAVKQPVFRVLQGEIGAERLRTAQVHNAAVGVVVGGGVRNPAVTEIDASRQPLLGRGDRRRCFFRIGRGGGGSLFVGLGAFGLRRSFGLG